MASPFNVDKPFNPNCSYDRDHLRNISYQLDVIIKLLSLDHNNDQQAFSGILNKYLKSTEK